MASLGGSWQGEARTCEGRQAELIWNQPMQLPICFLQQDCKCFSSLFLRIAPHPTRLAAGHLPPGEGFITLLF